MDLNLLYSQHQRALMQAGEATSSLTRTKQFATAALIAHRIRSYQIEKGAAAAEGWQYRLEKPDRPVSMHLGLST